MNNHAVIALATLLVTALLPAPGLAGDGETSSTELHAASAPATETDKSSPADQQTPSSAHESDARETETSGTDEPVPLPKGEATGYDTAEVGDEDFFSQDHRRRLYEKGKLKYGRAAALTALLPGLGNFYAQQYFTGGPAASLMGFAAVFIPYGLVTRQPGFSWAGVGMAGTAYATGFITSWFGVQRYNRQLKQGLRISLQPTHPWRAPAGRGVSFSIDF